MVVTRRKSVDQNDHTSPGQQRYRSSSFSTDIPIPSSPSLYGGNGFEYRAPYGLAESPNGRPSMSHSASLPTVLMAADDGPFGGSNSRRSSLSSAQGDASTPKKQSSTYNHPYLIHSSSSAVLSRTNTSPSVSYTALPTSTTGHRASKSMGFLRSSQSVDDLRSPEKGDGHRNDPPQKDCNQDGRPGYTASYTPPVRRKLVNRYSISNLSDVAQSVGKDHQTDKSNGKATGKLDMSVWEWKTGVKAETSTIEDLPHNPKAWNVHETAQYVAHCLSNGLNPNPNSGTTIMKLPPPVIQDITGWIKRSRITGKAFLAGGDSSWSSSSKSPPFLDVLLSLSRNLRRASLKGSIAGINWLPNDLEPKDVNRPEGIHGRDTSVLEEAENEDEDGETDDKLIAGKVKRLAHDFDTRSTGSMSTAGSEIAEEHFADRRRPRSTRAFSHTSLLSQARSEDEHNHDEKAKLFEHGLETINRQPTESVGAKFGRLVDTVHFESYSPAWDQAVALGGLSLINTVGRNVQDDNEMTRDTSSVTCPSMLSDVQPVGLGIFQHSPTKLKEHVIVEMDKMSPVSSFTSPPPAYTSAQFPDRDGLIPADPGNVVTCSDTALITPDPESADGPEADHQSIHDPADIPFTRASARPGPYGQLQNATPGESRHHPRLPTAVTLSKGGSKALLKAEEEYSGGNSEAEDEDPRDTARRVTIRPGRKISVKPVPTTPARPASPARSASVTPGRDRAPQAPVPELGHQMESLKEDLAAAQAKIRELERQLQEHRLADVPLPAAKQSGPLSNHQSLAMLYGGLTGLCVSILVFKLIGRKGLLT